MDFLIFFFTTLSVGTLTMDENSPGLEILELSNGLKGRSLFLRNSASRFLRQFYSEINEEISGNTNPNLRQKRENDGDNNFITELDRFEIEKCNNIVTIMSKRKNLRIKDEYVHLYFNTKDVPNELNLVHSTLRLFHDPHLTTNQLNHLSKNVTISVYGRNSFHPRNPNGINNFRILISLNMTIEYKGWLEFNITRLLNKWLKHRKFRSLTFLNEILIDATTEANNDFNALQLGLIHPGLVENTDRNPFVIGYFNGPQLVENLKKIRSKRESLRRRRPVTTNLMPRGMNALHLKHTYQMPKSCERLNFTVNFKEIYMDDVVIAPPKFEAYFCAGECNFPLGAHTNATNHAIVQTLMHLKQPHLPKPCCAPTLMEPIYILRFQKGRDTYNLVKYPQSVVKECGCH